MKFAKSFLTGTGAVLLAGLVFTLLAPKAAHAIAATLVQVTNTSANPVPNKDVDQQGRLLYQYYSNCTSTNGTCTITYPAVPAGQRLIIQHVSAIVETPSATTLNVVQFRGGGVYEFLPYQLATANYTNQYTNVINTDVIESFDTGQQPAIDAFSTSSAAFTTLATISGYMISYP